MRMAPWLRDMWRSSRRRVKRDARKSQLRWHAASQVRTVAEPAWRSASHKMIAMLIRLNVIPTAKAIR
jgi:hypothetical protein